MRSGSATDWGEARPELETETSVGDVMPERLDVVLNKSREIVVGTGCAILPWFPLGLPKLVAADGECNMLLSLSFRINDLSDILETLALATLAELRKIEGASKESERWLIDCFHHLSTVLVIEGGFQWQEGASRPVGRQVAVTRNVDNRLREAAPGTRGVQYS